MEPTLSELIVCGLFAITTFIIIGGASIALLIDKVKDSKKSDYKSKYGYNSTSQNVNNWGKK